MQVEMVKPVETGSRKSGEASGTGGFCEGKDCFHSMYTGEVYLGIIERSIPAFHESPSVLLLLLGKHLNLITEYRRI